MKKRKSIFLFSIWNYVYPFVIKRLLKCIFFTLVGRKIYLLIKLDGSNFYSNNYISILIYLRFKKQFIIMNLVLITSSWYKNISLDIKITHIGNIL